MEGGGSQLIVGRIIVYKNRSVPKIFTEAVVKAVLSRVFDEKVYILLFRETLKRTAISIIGTKLQKFFCSFACVS
jgi:hypothetical protein